MIIDTLQRRCAEAGFDLVAPFDVADFNALAAPADRLPDHGLGHALGVVVGNGRRLWPVFLAACRRDPAAARRPDPLDHYTVSTLTSAAEGTGCPFVALWAHRVDPRPIPIQRVAEVAGLARIAPCHLSVHPQLGPWLALRAVLVLDAEPAPPPSALAHPCTGCPQPCMEALARALPSKDWHRWLEVRDACPLGRDARYGEAQITYHYSKRGLEEALE
jgi:cyanocobalamin reductase (cyanide-eliminating) / alkylcobalamin dealkylase